MKTSLLFLLLSLTTYSDACTCFNVPEAIDSAIVNNPQVELFTGRIISRKRMSIESGRSYFVYTVKIKKRFTLNSEERKIQIISATQSSACGYRFAVGKKYLISTGKVNEASGMRHTSICRRNVLVKETQKELELIQSIVENGS
ncbi:MAG: hypothetical protein GQ574_03380 [Crocinitomix sp.]|nr:hypothetical protein [Crocinitomix sp.]